MAKIKNIGREQILTLAGEAAIGQGQVVSKTLAQNDAVSLTLFAFDEGEEISTHESEGDALVMVLEGSGRITIAGEEFVLEAGQSIVMPARRPHSIFALTPFKMFLAVIF